MEKIRPGASIIITTFNRSQILAERSLPSALNQTYPNFECIVVDGGSTDETPVLVEKFKQQDKRIRYIRMPENKGVSADRNCGAKNAKSDFIVFLDDDNALNQKFLEVTVPVLNRLPRVFGAVGCGRIIIDKHSKEYHLPSLSNSFYTAIDNGWLLRKEVFSKISYDETLLTDEDADFGIQFFRFYKAEIINKPLLSVYRVRKVGNVYLPSGSYPSERRFLGLKRFLDKNLPVFQAIGNKNDLAFIYRFAGRNYCWGGKMKEGIPLLRRAFLIKPGIRNLLNLLAAYCGHFVYRVYYWYLERGVASFVRSRFTHRVHKDRD